ncbi:CoA-binding protein [Marinobacter sp. HL-58]|uniref:CoA-binding protein n=1 Tax=Marinobacter sp. HL-58 TaxID=1479237 RepID=UPI000487B66F|nr:CoA-binding protein [Marinobacter sp. HL-58]KPP97471.1 MAG: putative CoA-binding protein [Marinobacter sp. HL-58]
MSRNNPEQLRRILETVRTIALVGASDKHNRPSHEVMAYLQGRGYRVIPVNPRLAGKTVLGEPVHADLGSISTPLDMVDVFLAPDRTDPIIDSAIKQQIPVIWMQIGVINEEGAERAEKAGLTVVMDKCPKQEIPRLGIPPVTQPEM